MVLATQSSSWDCHCPYGLTPLQDDSSSQTSGGWVFSMFQYRFGGEKHVEYRPLDMCCIPRVQSLHSFIDRTMANLSSVHSAPDAFPNVRRYSPDRCRNLNLPFSFSGWHAPLLRLTKTSIDANKVNTHGFNRLVNLFTHLFRDYFGGIRCPKEVKEVLSSHRDILL